MGRLLLLIILTVVTLSSSFGADLLESVSRVSERELYPYVTELPGEPARPLASLSPSHREAVLRGMRSFNDPILHRSGVPCVTCHPSLEMVRGWAAGYPKVQLTGPEQELKVLTLPQAIVRAFGAHSGEEVEVSSDRVQDVAVYLSWAGDGVRIRPGISGLHGPPDEWLRVLSDSQHRGREKFIARCGSCHRAGDLGGGAARFPRQPPGMERILTLDAFINRHRGSELNESEIADLTAYVVYLARGKSLMGGR